MGRILHGLGEWLQGEYSCCSEFVIFVEEELDIDLDIDDVSAARIREPFKYGRKVAGMRVSKQLLN